MPKLIPTVTPLPVLPLSFEQMAKKFDEVSAEELRRHGAMQDFKIIQQNSPLRAAQLMFIDKLIDMLKKPSEYNKMYDDEAKALILTGALLEIKLRIDDTYRYKLLWSADHSYVHANINSVIGMTDDSQYNDVKEKSKNAFEAFIGDGLNRAMVLSNVEQHELLKFAPIPKQIVNNQNLSSTALLLKKVVPREHVLDTTYMAHIKKHQRKDKKEELRDYKSVYTTIEGKVAKIDREKQAMQVENVGEEQQHKPSMRR